MRTPLWETSAGALLALLNGGGPLEKTDLYTLTLGDGTVYRWTSGDLAVTGNGHTWVPGPGLTRTMVRWVTGVPVDDMTVTITDIVGTTINGKSLMAFIRAGGLIGARMQVDKAFWPPFATQATGAWLWFAGRISVIDGGDRYQAPVTVTSDLELLDTMIPNSLYQSACLNTVYDSACTLSRAGFTATNAATSGTDPSRTTFSHTLSQATGYFSLGTVTMTSGANAGIARTVKLQTSSSGIISVLKPWPFPVAPGDTFSIVAGCDGTQATCTSKFANVLHFRGQPYIPAPDTIL